MWAAAIGYMQRHSELQRSVELSARRVATTRNNTVTTLPGAEMKQLQNEMMRPRDAMRRRLDIGEPTR
jgi:hypothetical protein